ncbi:MAG: tetratricopeptide repeat protein [Magnetococcales bacterium]|nr:tetratricopeptide repeat protein [Magnetococcales bacterium]
MDEQPTNTPVYTWLHLSDIHMGCRGNEIRRQVDTEFKPHIREMVKQLGAPDMILLTGDLAFSGKKEEYEQFDVFLNDMIDCIREVQPSASQPMLVPVPGNHDLARPDEDALSIDFSVLKRVAEGDTEALQKLGQRFFTKNNFQLIAPLFQSYQDWFKRTVLPSFPDTGVRYHCSDFPGDWSLEIDLPDRFPLRLVGLNSAWMHLSDQFAHKRMVLFSQQLHAALGNNNQLEFAQGPALLLLHHPPMDWFSSATYQRFKEEMYTQERFNACLFGHMHDEKTIRIGEAGGPLRYYFQAPSLFGVEKLGTSDEERRFGYGWGQVTKEGEIIIWPFLRSKRGGRQQFVWNPEFSGEEKSGHSFRTRMLEAATIEALSAPWKKLTEEQKATIHKQEKELGVGREAIHSFLAIFSEKEVPPEQWASKLKEIAERHKASLQQLQAIPKGSFEMVALKESAEKAIAEHRYEDADALFDQLLALQGEETASVWASRAELAMTRLRYKDAAQYFAHAADALPPSREEQKSAYKEEEANAWYQQGDEFGDNEALKNAIQVYTRLLEMHPRERFPLDWARVQNNLGNAFWKLGGRESGTASLTAAVTAYREALQEYTRERVPLDWAGTQNNLGNALQTLGERESGTESLMAAVTAYREALEERTRERVPLDWAGTQNNLGGALLRLGERESDTEKLTEVVTAFREALREYTRERVPLQWAMTQNNLGTALWSLGERENDTKKLTEAVTASREALQEWTRERVPFDWAMTQNNLGNALQTLGERESGTESLMAAVTAYREALKEYTRERVPLDWAQTQNNLGNAFLRLGEREIGTESLTAAVAAFQEALQEYTRERVPLDWAITQFNLGMALRALGERESGTEKLEAAVAAFEKALEVAKASGADYYIEMFQRNLNNCNDLLNQRKKGG